MDARAILDGLLENTQQATRTAMQMAEDKDILPPAGDERTAMLKGVGTGALAAGAVALLFGSKGTQKFAKKAVKLGGTAAIGGLAYKAYSEWQASQAQPLSPPSSQTASAGASRSLNLDQFEKGKSITSLSQIDAAVRSESIIQAMISAARADGHIDSDELALITRQINSLGLDKEISEFLLAELNKPVDVAAIAALADTPETAAELYIASAMVADVDGPAERNYLDSLASDMGLDPEMVQRLEEPLRS